MRSIHQAASTGAAAAVEALQSPAGPRQTLLERLEALHLGGVTYLGLVLAASSGAAHLCSGNLLATRARAALLAGPTLSEACIHHLKARVINDVSRASETLEDVRNIMSQSGSGAAVGVPLLEGATGSGSSAAAPAKPTCSAALLLGFPSAADVTAPALKGVLLLAHALAEEQRKPLQEFAETVLSLVLPQAAVPPPPLDAPLDARPQPEAQPALSDWSGDSDSSAEDGSVWGDEPGNGVRGEAAGLGGGLAPAPLVSLRGFRSGVQEARFAAHHAAQMLRLDACAYLLAFACFCLQASCPGTPLRLWRRMGPRCLLGAAAQLPGLLLLSGGTRPWFRAHRDALLALTWLAVAAWQQSLGSHLHPLASAPFRDPLHSHSFSWLTVMGLAFQMRFRYQAPAAIAAYAANVALLPASRTARCCEPPGAGCGPGAALRAALHGLLLPLACCYVFEAHARRLFLRSEARRRV